MIHTLVPPQCLVDVLRTATTWGALYAAILAMTTDSGIILVALVSRSVAETHVFHCGCNKCRARL